VHRSSARDNRLFQIIQIAQKPRKSKFFRGFFIEPQQEKSACYFIKNKNQKIYQSLLLSEWIQAL